MKSQGQQLAEILATRTAAYLLASAGLGPKDKLDADTLAKWDKYLKAPPEGSSISEGLVRCASRGQEESRR